jgi:hypothetical protein
MRHRPATVVAALVLLAACGDDTTTSASDDSAVIDPGDGGDYARSIDPADFVEVIDNPYLPLADGARWVYEGETEDGTERIEVVVTGERREVMGVSTVVVRDTATLDGEVIEETDDWFAQDRDGNVWYFGEETTDYESGEPAGTEGSWEAGVDGALPGIVMLADPTVGAAYRQEYLPGEAEDMGEVQRVDAAESVPFGSFDGLVVTEDWTPLEPDVVENKYYARGVGLILEVEDDTRVELIEHAP